MRIEKNNYLSFEMKDHACVYCISGYHDILHKNRWIIFYIQKKKGYGDLIRMKLSYFDENFVSSNKKHENKNNKYNN